MKMESLENMKFVQLISLAKKCEIDCIRSFGWKIYGHLRSLESLVKTGEIKMKSSWLNFKRIGFDDYPPTLKEATYDDLIYWNYDIIKDELTITLNEKDDFREYGRPFCEFVVFQAHRYFYEFFEHILRSKIENFLYLQYEKQELSRIEAEKEKILNALLSSCKEV